MKRRLFLHAGSGKTGTSTIQLFLSSNRAALASRGYYYPRTPGTHRHKLLSWAARTEAEFRKFTALQASHNRLGYLWNLFRFRNHEDLRGWLRKALEKELDSANQPNVVMSDEGLFSLVGPEFSRLDQLIGDLFDQIVILVYLRRQDEQVLSRYKQSLREGRTHTLDEIIDRRPRHLNYFDRLRNLRDDFPGYEIRARAYSKSRFADKPLIADLLDSLEIDGAQGFEIPQEEHNPSLDAICAEYLRRHNQSRGAMNRRQLNKLLRLATGPDFYFSGEDRTRFMANFEASNRKLVEQFLPDAEDVFLAPPPEIEGIAQSSITDSDLLAIERRMKRRVIAPR